MSINLNEIYIYIYIYKIGVSSKIKCTCEQLFFYYFISFIPLSVSHWNELCDSVFDTVRKDTSSSSSSSRDGLIGPLPAKCRPKAFDAHSFTTFRERGKTG